MKTEAALFNFTCKGISEFQTSGIFHKNGFMYATNKMIGAKLNYVYDEELEDKIINKTGDIIKGDYPNLALVIERALSSSAKWYNDGSKIIEAIKIFKINKTKSMVGLRIENTLFQFKLLKIVIDLFESIDEKPLIKMNENGTVLVFKSEKCTAVCYSFNPEENDLIFTVDDVLSKKKIKGIKVEKIKVEKCKVTSKMKKQEEDMNNKRIFILSKLSEINSIILGVNLEAKVFEEKLDITSEVNRSSVNYIKGKIYKKRMKSSLNNIEEKEIIKRISEAGIIVDEKGIVTINYEDLKGKISFDFRAVLTIEKKVRQMFPNSAIITPVNSKIRLGNPSSNFHLNSVTVNQRSEEILQRVEMNKKNIEQAKLAGMFNLMKVFQDEILMLTK